MPARVKGIGNPFSKNDPKYYNSEISSLLIPGRSYYTYEKWIKQLIDFNVMASVTVEGVRGKRALLSSVLSVPLLPIFQA